jgi:hypothetical protein
MRFSLHLYFASCRLLQHARKGCILRHLYIAALLQTFGSTDVTFVYIVGKGLAPSVIKQTVVLACCRAGDCSRRLDKIAFCVVQKNTEVPGVPRKRNSFLGWVAGVPRKRNSFLGWGSLLTKKPWGYSQGFLR